MSNDSPEMPQMRGPIPENSEATARPQETPSRGGPAPRGMAAEHGGQPHEVRAEDENMEEMLSLAQEGKLGEAYRKAVSENPDNTEFADVAATFINLEDEKSKPVGERGYAAHISKLQALDMKPNEIRLLMNATFSDDPQHLSEALKMLPAEEEEAGTASDELEPAPVDIEVLRHDTQDLGQKVEAIAELHKTDPEKAIKEANKLLVDAYALMEKILTNKGVKIGGGIIGGILLFSLLSYIFLLAKTAGKVKAR